MMPEATGSTIADALVAAKHRLADLPSPELDAGLLLAHVLEVRRSWLYAHRDDGLCAVFQAAFDALLTRRQQGEPVAYLLGEKAFWTMTLTVDSSTLVPRPETECLVEAVLAQRSMEPGLQVADLGTGTGAIAIALARERPAWQIIATDHAAAPLRVAGRNVERWAPNTIRLCQTDWLDGFAPASLDVIVSNPPYVRSDDEHLAALRFEPESALVAGTDGLDALRRIVVDGFEILRSGGLIAVEHGHDQQADVMALMRSRGYEAIGGASDLAGIPRVTFGEKP